MNRKSNQTLRKELKQSGAKDSEIESLVSVANNLKSLKTVGSASNKRSKRLLILDFGLVGLVCLVAGMFIVVFSQTVLPGSVLYPVQKLSNSVATAVDPQYRGTVMMKQAEQVRLLVADNASSSTVLATLASYQVSAANYKDMSKSYAAFEYCKNNLQQAEAIASGTDRQAISKTLQSLNDV